MEDKITKEFEQIQQVYDTIIEFFVNYSFQLVGALIVLLIGLFVASRVSKSVNKLCISKGLDITLSRFIANIIKLVIVAMVVIISLNKLGVSVTPFIAAIGALSLGAGLALQGLLSNYGAGLNIILTRPFIVGDTINVQGVNGQVIDILLAYTILKTEDDVIITIPNKHIIGEIICNTHSVSLLELSIGVSYASDLDLVSKMLLQAIEDNSNTNHSKKPMVGISGFGDSSVDFELRVWVNSDNINNARFSLNKSIWDCLQENNVDIPFPQREVRMLTDPS